MAQLKTLGRAIAPALRRLYDRCVAADPLLPGCLLRQRDLFEPLEPRRMTDTPVGPALTLQYFGVTDPENAASYIPVVTTPVGVGQMGDFADTVGTAYDPTHPFHARFTGSFETDDADPTTYYFRLPTAEGAVLTIDGQHVMYAASWAGDTNLDGTVNTTDVSYMIAAGHFWDGTGGHGWTDGDFNNDGFVDGADIDAMIAAGHYRSGATITPYAIDNLSTSGGSAYTPIGFTLSAGQHDIELDYYQFNDATDVLGRAASPALTWSTNGTDFSGLAAMSGVSPYERPKVMAVAAAADEGAAPAGPMATFSPAAPGTAAAFEAAVARWAGAAAAAHGWTTVSLDGKTLRGSTGVQLPAVHLLAARAHEAGIVLRQMPVDVKTNEHKTALELLDLIPVAGKLVTGDAMFCQRDLSRKIRAKKGDYLWPVKDNQPDLLAAIDDAFDDADTSPSPAATGPSRAPDRPHRRQGARPA